MTKTPTTPKQIKTAGEKKPRKPSTPDTRPPHEIFGARLNDELRQMNRRYENILKLTRARKAHGEDWQVEEAIKWMESHHTEAVAALRASLQKTAEAAPGAPKTFSVVPLSKPAEQPAQKASS